jgi:hypothetical protein
VGVLPLQSLEKRDAEEWEGSKGYCILKARNLNFSALKFLRNGSSPFCYWRLGERTRLQQMAEVKV